MYWSKVPNTTSTSRSKNRWEELKQISNGRKSLIFQNLRWHWANQDWLSSLTVSQQLTRHCTQSSLKCLALEALAWQMCPRFQRRHSRHPILLRERVWSFPQVLHSLNRYMEALRQRRVCRDSLQAHVLPPSMEITIYNSCTKVIAFMRSVRVHPALNSNLTISENHLLSYQAQKDLLGAQ